MEEIIMLIYKEELLQHTGIEIIKLPYLNIKEAKEAIMKLDVQYGIPCMWYMNNKENETKDYILCAIGTGHDYKELEKESYIGSLLLFEGSLVLHYFLIEATGEM